MSAQPEQLLEDSLIAQLAGLGYEYLPIRDEAALLANLKTQLEKHNGVALSDTEFGKVLNHLDKGSVFERAKILRDRFHLARDNGDSLYIQFLNSDAWCQNQYQVIRQLSMEGAYKNRYDVTLLINGLPLVQIELKRRGLELKEAFNQINRYHRHSYSASHGLFQYVQVFVISNGVNTKYYANNRKQTFKQTFYWTDLDNRPITRLEAFAEAFLEKCHLSKMICKYIVLHESDKIPMILRPYQFYAAEAIIERVQHGTRNGYIWHTTGSGKTLTSFKAAQVLIGLPQVHKVVFVVDRNDLDYQTTREFNHFSEGSVDGTSHTGHLVRQFADDTRLIVTTIQKLNTAISKRAYLDRMAPLRDKRVVFIFDECHRSQFGDTHKRIRAFFEAAQLFGFTGTPIFAENAVSNQLGKRTTKELFHECLHKYVITDAIRDENVLKFSIEYVGRYQYKDGTEVDLDIQVEDIDTRELLDSPRRLEKIVDYIIRHHRRKTYNLDFSAIFCVSSVDALIRYYDIFKAKKAAGEHDLRVVTIFTFGANEDDKDANGLIGEPELDIDSGAPVNQHSRDALEACIADYNALFNVKHSTRDSQAFQNYYKDIAKRFKEREKEHFKDSDRADILLVVNMFLTGFDAKKVNTLYVDKNLRHHGLIQAFSRTNRIDNEVKSHGQIVCFRNLKKATDEAIALFSNLQAREEILVQPYEVYVRKFNEALKRLLTVAPTVDSVNDLPSEEEELEFVQAFRDLIRLKNILSAFSDFNFEDLAMDEQSFEDYKSKYLDIHDKVKSPVKKEKVSILNDVDFELELIHRDEVNVAYILRLLASLHEAKQSEKDKQREAIIDMLGGEAQLRSKRELIEKFILENLPLIHDANDIPQAFETFWDSEKKRAFDALCTEEQLLAEPLQELISQYLFTEHLPLSDDIANLMTQKPKLLERRPAIERIRARIMGFVEAFFEGMGEV